MAIARLSIKVGKAGKAGPHAAYIARQGQYAKHLERGEKLEASEAGNMPAWAQHRAQLFWCAADAHERSNGTTYREMEIALPRELNPAQRVALVREFVQQELGGRHAYQWAIHSPTAADDKEQPHVHLMFSERQVDGLERDPEHYFKRYNAKLPEKGGARKGFGPQAGQTLSAAERAAELKALRLRWQDMANQHLEQAGVEARIDMRSHAERETGLEPEAKQLPSQWRSFGRANVIEFRAARREQQQAHAELRRVVPDAGALIIDLERARAARQLAQVQAVEGMSDFRARFQAHQEQQATMAAEQARRLADVERQRQEQLEQQIAAERAAALERESQVSELEPDRDSKSKREGSDFGL